MSDGLSQEMDQVSEVPEIPAAPKTYTQEQLEKAMHSRLQNEREKHEREKAQLVSQFKEQQSSLPSGVGSKGPTMEEIQSMMDEKLKNVIEAAGQRAVASKVLGDLQARISSDPEVQELVVKRKLSKFPQLVPLSLTVDNTASVLKELLSNPLKAKAMTELYSVDQELAEIEIAQLSASIKQNEAAKIAKPKEPLSQVKASTAAVDSGEKGNVRDYFNKYRQEYRKGR